MSYVSSLSGSTDKPITNQSIVSNAMGLNVWESANKDSEIVCTLNQGDEVLVEDVSDGWAHIYTSVGIEGYTRVEYITVK